MMATSPLRSKKIVSLVLRITVSYSSLLSSSHDAQPIQRMIVVRIDQVIRSPGLERNVSDIVAVFDE